MASIVLQATIWRFLLEWAGLCVPAGRLTKRRTQNIETENRTEPDGPINQDLAALVEDTRSRRTCFSLALACETNCPFLFFFLKTAGWMTCFQQWTSNRERCSCCSNFAIWNLVQGKKNNPSLSQIAEPSYTVAVPTFFHIWIKRTDALLLPSTSWHSTCRSSQVWCVFTCKT